MLTLVDDTEHLRALCDGAEDYPGEAMVAVDLYAGDEPEDGVELELVAYDPALPGADVPADVVERLPAPAPLPVVHEAAIVDAAIAAHRAGVAAARAAWTMGLRAEPSAAEAHGDVVIVLRGHYIEPEGEALRVALGAYQRTHAALRAQNGGAS